MVSVIPFLGAQPRGATLGLCVGGCMVALFYGIKSLRTFNYRLLIVVLSVICIGLGFYSINTIVKHQILESKPLQTMSIDNNSSIHTDDKIKSLSRSYDRERILLWKSSYNMWQDYPMLGVDWSNWQYMYQNHYIFDKAKERELSMPHNNIAYFFSTTGVVGGIGYLIFTIGLFVYIIKEFNKDPESCLLPSFL
ncbi:O-antigen ligase family protein [Veillonella sp.]|uniref:O-antigen ligase family protein n=1 Tax=Veillonella sp. TaxID=1926307 RepID=UPI00257FE005|nr:O-antigen ligase family protein [Veillonella sp.]